MSYGEAYAFFRYAGAADILELALPDMRQMAQAPSALELTLSNTQRFFHLDDKLMSFVVLARTLDLNYVLAGRQQGVRNADVADSLGNVVNQLGKSALYRPTDPFIAQIIFMREEDYILKE
jgi:hypothetical protein